MGCGCRRGLGDFGSTSTHSRHPTATVLSPLQLSARQRARISGHLTGIFQMPPAQLTSRRINTAPLQLLHSTLQMAVVAAMQSHSSASHEACRHCDNAGQSNATRLVMLAIGHGSVDLPAAIGQRATADVAQQARINRDRRRLLGRRSGGSGGRVTGNRVERLRHDGLLLVWSCMDVLHEPSFHQRPNCRVTVNSYSLRIRTANARMGNPFPVMWQVTLFSQRIKAISAH